MKTKQKFKFYLHDDETNILEYLEEQGFEFSDDAKANLNNQNPFYEVTLECEVDKHGNITLLGAKL